MNLVFQIEPQPTADGDLEIVDVECNPTSDDVSDTLTAEEIAVGSWVLRFVVNEDFDGNEAVFGKCARYGLDPAVLHAACAEAAQAEN